MIDDIKKCFQIRGNKYKNFDLPNGHESLYKMTVSICKQLFGNDILISKKYKIRVKGRQIGSVKHNFNNDYFNGISKFF